MIARPQPPFTLDGTLRRNDLGRLREIDGAPGMHAVMEVQFESDRDEGVARDFLSGKTGEAIAVIRSGLAQAGLDLTLHPEKSVTFKPRRALAPVILTSHRGATRDQLLSVLRTMVQDERKTLSPGGVLFIPPESALTASEIEDERAQEKLLLPDGSEIRDDGTVEIPLHGGYIFGEDVFDDEAMRRLIRDGRSGIKHLRRPVPLPAHLPAGGFLLASMRGLSLGRTQGVIRRKLNVPGMEHLAAFQMHPIRTMGTRLARQAEIINRTDEAVRTDELRLRMRLHPASRQDERVAARVVNPRSLREGITLHDLVPLQQLIRLSSTVSAHRPSPYAANPDRRPYGLLIGRGRAAEIPWASDGSFQDTLSIQRAKRFVSALPSDRGQGWVDGQGIPEAAKPLASELGYVSQDDHSRMLVTDGFPDPDAARALHGEGVGVFVARALHREPDAYSGSKTTHHVFPAEDHDAPVSTGGESMKQHALFFDTTRYEAMREMERQGATFFMVLRDMTDEMERGAVVPAHIRELFRGLWVKPEAKETVRKVNTIIAMYGSHKEDIGELLQPELDAFLLRMKRRFGDALGVTHGKGPGMMKAADKAAENAGVCRIGVGICIEGQAGNCRPEAMVDFHDTDRLRRQKLMDDLATFKIFNLGGAGTLEEAAITICSQKLGKKAITPIIFVDPIGAGEGGGNLWQRLKDLIALLATRQEFERDEQKVLLAMLQEETPRYLHCVPSYDEAAGIIEGFAAEPGRYYGAQGIPDSAVRTSFDRQRETLRQTGFDPPNFLEEWRSAALPAIPA